MTSPDSPARTAHRAWRPMAFGPHKVATIRTPIIEPLWSGTRVLVHVAESAVTIVDPDGAEVDGWPDLRETIVRNAFASELILDGYLTTELLRDTAGVHPPIVGATSGEERPGIGRRLFLGAGRTSTQERFRRAEAARLAAIPTTDEAAFVAVDLLWMDDEPLLDVPLGERKRLLESVLREAHLVRRTAHVSPPAEAWFGQWRAFGFQEIAVKDANSVYRPGDRC